MPGSNDGGLKVDRERARLDAFEDARQPRGRGGKGVDGVRTGLERVLDECPAELRGRRVGLLTNLTGVDRDLRPAVERLAALPDLSLERLFAMEHGLYGDIPAGGAVEDSTDPRTGLPVVSVYGAGHKATAAMVAGLDAVLVDLQDIGARYYTMLGTTLELVAACHEAGVALYVLDRPNPLGGAYEGQRAVAPAYRSLVGAAAVPMRHGLTLGELTLLGAREQGHEDAVRVVPLEGWRRSERWESLGRPWLAPSPNTNSLEMARLYPGTCLFEGTNLSEGRGTAMPFLQIGAPWLDPFALADALRPRLGPGLWCRPVAFRPTYSKHEGTVCRGVMLHVDPTADAEVVPASIHLLSLALAQPESRILEPRQPGGLRALDRLAGDDRLRNDLSAGRPPEDILAGWRRELADWPAIRSSVSLYAD